jgi:hypothetical protein
MPGFPLSLARCSGPHVPGSLCRAGNTTDSPESRDVTCHSLQLSMVVLRVTIALQSPVATEFADVNMPSGSPCKGGGGVQMLSRIAVCV